MLTIERGIPDSSYGRIQYAWRPTGVYADEILFTRVRGYGEVNTLHAMSIIGPEQQVRSIAAYCAMSSTTPTRFRFTGPTDIVDAQWRGPWRCRAVVLHGAMHLVALPEVKVAANEGEADQTHIIIAQQPTRRSLCEAIYRRLVACYSTPLIPVDQPGQPEAERKAGLIWQNVIVTALLGMKGCSPLHVHTDQPGKSWSMAVRLRLGNQTLDDLVSQLCRNGILPFPSSARVVPSPREAPSSDSPCLQAAI